VWHYVSQIINPFFVLIAPITNSGDAQTLPSAFTAKSSAPDGELQFDACRIGYRTFGTLNREHSNAILFPTWYNGTSNDLKQFFGPERMVDTSRYFGIALDAFGNGISSSPSNSSSQKGADFPAFTIRDMVHAEYRVVTEVLHLQHVQAVMGVSMGGHADLRVDNDASDFHGQSHRHRRHSSADFLRSLELGRSANGYRI
jgi:homoserine acetyltransferase